MSNRNFETLLSLVVETFEPPVEDLVADWCENHVVIPPPQSKASGLISFAGRDYMREALNSWNTRGITDVTLCFGSQTGKTTLLQCGVAYLMARSPTGIVWVMPSIHLAESFSTNRWQPIVRATDALERMIPKGGQNRHLFKKCEQTLGSSLLTFLGANSPANLSSRPARVVIQDEQDKFPEAGKREADASNLADQRSKDSDNPLRVKTSTPTVTTGPIWQAFTRGDQRRYHVPCPLCRKLVVLIWGKNYTVFPLTGNEAPIVWDKEAKRPNGDWDEDRVMKSARAVCPHCGGDIEDGRKTWMLRESNGAKWVPTHPEIQGYRSYHLPSWYAPGVQTSFGSLAVKFLREKKSFAGLQGFINGEAAEPWENQDGRAERIEVITTRPIEGGIRQLTADVQAVAPFFWWVVREWGPGGVSRLVGAGWCDDFAALRRVQLHFGVHDLDVMVDSGFNTQTVYDACSQWSQPVSGVVKYESGLRFPADGTSRAPALLGWTPSKGREEGYRFTASDGKIHPVGLSATPSIRSDVVQPLVIFDTEHLRALLSKMRRPGEGTALWSVCQLPAHGELEGVCFVGPDEYWRHLDSHQVRNMPVGRLGKTKSVAVKRNSRWPDHLHDCEIQQLAQAFLWGRLPV